MTFFTPFDLSPRRGLAALVFAILSAAGAAHAAPVPSVPTNLVLADNFDSGLAGWVSAGNGAGAAVAHASGGHSGGYISVADSSPGWAYFSAPAAYRHAALADGVLSFDMAAFADANHSIAGDVRVALVGKDANGNKLTLVGELAGSRPTADWAGYSFSFGATPGNVFRVQEAIEGYSESFATPTAEQWAQVMGTLTEFLIGADYSSAFASDNGNGGMEEAWLDNVRYQATFLPQEETPPGGPGTPTPLPEPGTLALLLAGLGLTWGSRKVRASRSG